VSAQPSHSAPEPGARASQQPGGNQGAAENPFADAYLQIDPQQQFREYSSPERRDIPASPFPPAYTTPGFYQPAGAEQTARTAGYQANGSYSSVAGYQSNGSYPGQIPGAAGYQPGGSYPGVAGYQPNGGYPSQTPGVPAQMPPYPGYNPYMPYPGYPAYGYGYNYGYGWPAPVQPKRDPYLLGVAITAFICSCLAILGGLGSLALLGLFNLAASVPSTSSDLSRDTYFASVILLLTFAIAGLVGGGFCMYHSIRSLFLKKPSRAIWLPSFWIFLLCYLLTLALGFWLHSQGLDASSPALTGLLIYLGGVFPALTILALGIRRLRDSQRVQWPTSWRRLTLALVSGATLAVALAGLLEFVFELLLVGSQNADVIRYISDPNAGNPPPSIGGILLILLAVIAPIVEEMVKPLAVIILIGRVRSKAEAFALGLACGIGFNLVETVGYISQTYNDWLNVALLRSGAGLLHGFGAAMVALGWYYLTHKEEGSWTRRSWLALGCIGYAILQHALWNGWAGLSIFSGPISNFQNWSLNLGPILINGLELVLVAETIAMLIFFIFMSGRVRSRPEPEKDVQPDKGALITSM
jgi:RsiW-degrading membrane proteinase PrsW (M82 family)